MSPKRKWRLRCAVWTTASRLTLGSKKDENAIETFMSCDRSGRRETFSVCSTQTELGARPRGRKTFPRTGGRPMQIHTAGQDALSSWLFLFFETNAEFCEEHKPTRWIATGWQIAPALHLPALLSSLLLPLWDFLSRPWPVPHLFFLRTPPLLHMAGCGTPEASNGHSVNCMLMDRRSSSDFLHSPLRVQLPIRAPWKHGVLLNFALPCKPVYLPTSCCPRMHSFLD